MAFCVTSHGIQNFTGVGDKPTRKSGRRSRRHSRPVSPEIKLLLQQPMDVLEVELFKNNLPTKTVYWLGSREVCRLGAWVLNTVFHRPWKLEIETHGGRFTPRGLLEHLRENEGQETYLVEEEDLIPDFIQSIRHELGREGHTCNFVGFRHQHLEAIYRFEIDLNGRESFGPRWINPHSPAQIRAGNLHRPVRLR